MRRSRRAPSKLVARDERPDPRLRVLRAGRGRAARVLHRGRVCPWPSTSSRWAPRRASPGPRTGGDSGRRRSAHAPVQVLPDAGQERAVMAAAPTPHLRRPLSPPPPSAQVRIVSARATRGRAMGGAALHLALAPHEVEPGARIHPLRGTSSAGGNARRSAPPTLRGYTERTRFLDSLRPPSARRQGRANREALGRRTQPPWK